MQSLRCKALAQAITTEVRGPQDDAENLIYAVNVTDMTKDTILSQFLLGPVLQGRQIIEAEKSLDGQAVLLECDCQRAQAIVNLIRTRYGKNLFRFYTSKTGKAWKRV